MLLAHKIELYPTSKQSDYLFHCVANRRYMYNVLVAYYRDTSKLTKTIAQELVKEHRAKFDWLQDVSTRVIRNTVDDIDKAIKKGWTPEAKAKRAKAIKEATTLKQKSKAIYHGLPSFAKRGINESFAIREKEKIRVNGRKFKFEKLPKELREIKMRELIRFNGTVKQVTISLRAGKWFASFLVETDDIKKQEPSFENVGVDLGVKELATLSDGKVFPAHKSYAKREKKLRQLNKKLARQVKDSSGWKETKAKIQKLHYYVSESRKQALHELTSWLSKNYKRIVIEDLAPSNMVKNRRLAKSIIDAGFGMFKEQMAYKCVLYDSELVLADRFFPSSKTCSNCGNVKKELKLSERTYICKECGFKLDRDVNASLNLAKWRPV